MGRFPDGFTTNASTETGGINPQAQNITCLANNSDDSHSTEACGASCSANFWPKDYQRSVAMRKLVYDTQGGHYTSPIRECGTLVDHGEGEDGDFNFARYTVKIPEEYNATCINSTMCDLNGTFALFHHCGCVDTPTKKCTVDEKTSCLSQHCHEKAMLTASDAMWQASWLAGCSYLWDASGLIVAASGPCDTAGDGFIYVFSTTAYTGVIYLVLIMVSYLGMHAFDSKNYAENIQHTQNKLGFGDEENFESSGMEMVDPSEMEKDSVYDGTDLDSKTDYDDSAMAVTGQI